MKNLLPQTRWIEFYSVLSTMLRYDKTHTILTCVTDDFQYSQKM